MPGPPGAQLGGRASAFGTTTDPLVPGPPPVKPTLDPVTVVFAPLAVRPLASMLEPAAPTDVALLVEPGLPLTRPPHPAMSRSTNADRDQRRQLGADSSNMHLYVSHRNRRGACSYRNGSCDLRPSAPSAADFGPSRRPERCRDGRQATASSYDGLA
jgi:hypothetical protein